VIAEWEKEIRTQASTNRSRAKDILDLESKLHELRMEKNEALYKVRKGENEIQMLNSAMEEYGYIHSRDQETSSLDNLKVVLSENERLKEEMRALIESTVRDRQKLEANQRSAISEIPGMVSKQYHAAIQEFGRKVNQEQVSQSE